MPARDAEAVGKWQLVAYRPQPHLEEREENDPSRDLLIADECANQADEIRRDQVPGSTQELYREDRQDQRGDEEPSSQKERSDELRVL